MSTSTQPATISFKKQGSLFVSDGGNAKTMVENLEQQQKAGVNAEILDRRSISKLFPSINCKDINFKNRSRPCIEYQMNRCSAPCVGNISKRDYAFDIKNTINLT